MNKNYIIKICEPSEENISTKWRYISDIHAGYCHQLDNRIASFSYNETSYKADAMQFTNLEDAKIVFDFVNHYNRKYNRALKIDIDSI